MHCTCSNNFFHRIVNRSLTSSSVIRVMLSTYTLHCLTTTDLKQETLIPRDLSYMKSYGKVGQNPRYEGEAAQFARFNQHYAFAGSKI